MTVKDVLQSLVDDNMVDCERVGTSNYYWAFPSKALHARKHKLEELQKQVRGLKKVTSYLKRCRCRCRCYYNPDSKNYPEHLFFVLCKNTFSYQHILNKMYFNTDIYL